MGRYSISDNPTLVPPMLLKLAALDNRSNVVYIARQWTSKIGVLAMF